MAQPFAANTWAKRPPGAPQMQLNGVYSGIVTGTVSGVYDARTRTIQAFGAMAHHFRGFTNMAAISFNDGASWTHSFNAPADLINQVAITGWSLPHPSFLGNSIHYQIRWDFEHAFLVFDGSVTKPGSLSLWASDGGSAFFKLQDLHNWPAINQIGGNLGTHAPIGHFPAVTQPILLTGSGPNGEDAYWMASAFNHSGGGLGNLTNFKESTLWRSLDGGITWEAVRDLIAAIGDGPVSQIVRSTSGRLLLIGGGSTGIWWTDGDLLTGTFTDASFDGAFGVRGTLMEMYGGTFFTFSQGTLTGPGSAWISCDDGANFMGSDALIPQNAGGYGIKLGPTEVLVVAPTFDAPTTETAAYYSANSGEDFQSSGPWSVSDVGERPVGMGLRTNGTPIVITRTGGIYLSGDRAQGIAGTRTICPLANAGLAAARPLVVCGHPLTHLCEDH